ncbi:MAG: hypothetical protein ACFBSD_10655 [Paracoccaceae bacterium]
MRFLRLCLELGLLVFVPVAIFACYYLFADDAARRFYILDMQADYISGVIAAIVFLALTQAPLIPREHRIILSLLWIMRAGVTLGFSLFYEARYRLDAVWYFNTGVFESGHWAYVNFGDGTYLMYALVGELSTISESYTYLKVCFSFVGLAAVYLFYLACRTALGREDMRILLALGMFPSLMFWTSILGKDPVTSFGIAVFSLGVVGFIRSRRFDWLWLVAAGLLIASAVRLWLAPIFIAPLAMTALLTSRTSVTFRATTAAIGVPAFLWAAGLFAERFEIDTARDLVQTTDTLSRAWATGGSGQQIQSFDSLGAMVAFLPWGAFTALFRPLPGEVNNIFGVLAGVENALLLGLVLFGLCRFGVRKTLRDPVVLWAVLTLLAWAAIYGFVSSQNLGTAFRFRAQVTPILLPLALYLAFAEFRRPAIAARRAPA